jgi:hypothetical protein
VPVRLTHLRGIAATRASEPRCPSRIDRHNEQIEHTLDAPHGAPASLRRLGVASISGAGEPPARATEQR